MNSKHQFSFLDAFVLLQGKTTFKILIWMVYAFREGSVGRVGCLKYFGARNMEMFCRDGVLYLAKNSGISDLEVVFQGGD